MSNEIPEFLRVLDALNQQGVDYMVVGGYAVNYYGHSRTTGDVDVYLKDSVENRKKLIAAFEKLGYGTFDALDTVPILAGFCEIMMDDGMYMDLMTRIPGIEPDKFDEDLAMCEISEVMGVAVPYIGLQQLLANKQSTGRPKDLLDIEALKSIRK